MARPRAIEPWSYSPLELEGKGISLFNVLDFHNVKKLRSPAPERKGNEIIYQNNEIGAIIRHSSRRALGLSYLRTICYQKLTGARLSYQIMKKASQF